MRLQIAVDNAHLMSLCNPGGNLDRDLEGRGRIDRADVDLLPQRAPLVVGHGDEEPAVRLVDTVKAPATDGLSEPLAAAIGEHLDGAGLLRRGVHIGTAPFAHITATRQPAVCGSRVS